MHLALYVPAVLTALSLAPSVSADLFLKQQNGHTRLAGTSFGVSGINATFDYVIVGGGTAGLTVASRLAEYGKFSVAVVEAGGFAEIENGNLSQIPAMAPRFASDSIEDIQAAVDWGIITEPEPTLNNRRLHYTQGKCLGGSSVRNYLVYQRSTKGSFQRWADVVGDQSFTFDDILPYFKRSVTFTPPNYVKRGPHSNILYDSEAFDSSGGPLQVSYANYYSPTSLYVKRGFEKLGLAETAGAQSGKLLGFTEYPYTLDPDDATRSSSETSFLQYAMLSTNLQIYQHTLAKRILFNGSKSANSVLVDTSGASYILTANKEVIISAGALRSPQLLMVSGIGPRNTLMAHGIPVLSNLEGVGKNWIDQPFFGPVYSTDVVTQSQLTNNASFFSDALQSYLGNASGPLTTSVANYLAWEKLPASYRTALSSSTIADLDAFPEDWPDIQIDPIPSAAVATNGTGNYFSIYMTLQTTTSRGNVTISSADTSDNPVVRLNWLTTSTDREVAVAAFRRAREVAVATGLAALEDEAAPGPTVQSDADILEYIADTATAIFHASGTCTMGRPENPQAVVDSAGLVYGVEGLRIIDASIFPILPPGQTQANISNGNEDMLAEKIADQILELSNK
ncbi:GMC oxidoreductase [Aplosporella prunicola CBS 121167]|uniref:GMC oxidoreductase n=1 Tax=Aplosporella prunicola CBS 121167 TaxID=1176127 RepID=A0A6A6AWC5_9PEZI|nr:GMC oxidoreductase [Aplosporella prunicola CBS 121167]KAF2135275.1 GMC oxidoreductase [Aplosporella prunicola CBS 121167]